MRITAKGQVTIPLHIRQEAGLLPHSEVEFIWDGKSVRLVAAKRPRHETRGQRLVRHLRGKATVSLSTDAIMKMARDR